MDHQDVLVTAASIIAGFGAAVMAFRLERELDIEEKNEERPKNRRERHWIPVSDWLVVTASVGGAVLCRCTAGGDSDANGGHDTFRVSNLLGNGYNAGGLHSFDLGSLPLHLRLRKERTNPTLWEGVFVLATVVAAATAFAVSYRG